MIAWLYNRLGKLFLLIYKIWVFLSTYHPLQWLWNEKWSNLPRSMLSAREQQLEIRDRQSWMQKETKGNLEFSVQLTLLFLWTAKKTKVPGKKPQMRKQSYFCEVTNGTIKASSFYSAVHWKIFKLTRINMGPPSFGFYFSNDKMLNSSKNV